jgi:hypothetical protein
VGEDGLLRELAAELARPRWKGPAPAEQLARLSKVEADAERPAPWRAAAKLLLERLSPKKEQ